MEEREEDIRKFGEYIQKMLSCRNYVYCRREGGCDPDNCPDYQEEE